MTARLEILDDSLFFFGGGTECLEVTHPNFHVIQRLGKEGIKRERNILSPPEPKNLIKMSLLNRPVMLDKLVDVNFKDKVLP